VCGRLGYNARLRLWSGKKKKWQKRGRFYDELKTGKASPEEKTSGYTKQAGNSISVVNPVVVLTNEERRGYGTANQTFESTRSDQQRKKNPTPVKSMIRRKDVHGMVQSQKTGRKRMYGGVKRKTIRNDIQQQRAVYKQLKSENERRYRKGIRVSQASYVKRDPADRGIQRGLVKQRKQNHRMARTEVRVDMRRWRSGRVPTLQMGRDLIEHGYVVHVNENGMLGSEVKWQGARVEVGHGRKLKEEVWKKIKGRSRGLLEHEEYGKTASRYREVDYVTGRRVLLRKAGSNEVIIPKGMDLSGWTSF